MSPLLRRLFTVFLILAIIVFAFPGGLKGWLDEYNRSGWLDAPVAVMRAVDAASTALGAKAVGQHLRGTFRKMVGGDDD